MKFNDGVDDDDIKEFCGGEAGAGECWSMGHPGHGGIPLATLRMSEAKLEALFEQYPGMVEFIEPDSPVDVEPAMYAEEATSSELGQWNLDKVNMDDAKFTGKGA